MDSRMDKVMPPGVADDYLRLLGYDEIDNAFPDGSFPMPKQLIDFEKEVRGLTRRESYSAKWKTLEMYAPYMYLYFVTLERLRRLEAQCARLRGSASYRDMPEVLSSAVMRCGTF